MSALLRIQNPAPPAQTLEERVRAAVPARFDVEVFIPPAGDFSFSRTCRLRGCTRHSSVFGMCPSHRALQEQGSLSARAFRVVRNRLLEMGVQSVFETLVPSAAEVSSKPNMFIALDQSSATPRADHMGRAFLRRVINAAAQVHHPMAFEERDKSLVAQVGSIKRLDAYLASLERPPRGIDGLTREHLEGFMLHLRQSLTVESSRPLTSVRTLLHSHRDLEWEPRLGKGGVIRSGEGRFSRPPVPRPVHPHVLNQLMAPEFLERIEPWLKTALLLGRHQGLRPSSVVTLPFECLSFAGDEPGGADLPQRQAQSSGHATHRAPGGDRGDSGAAGGGA